MIPYPIGDMLTRIRNANRRYQRDVTMPHSRMKESIARILRQEGYIEGYEVIEGRPQPQLRIRMKYMGDRVGAAQAITEIRLVSKPSRRVYAGKVEIPRPLGGMGITIVSTSEGVVSGKEAQARGVGGEILCEVW